MTKSKQTKLKAVTADVALADARDAANALIDDLTNSFVERDKLFPMLVDALIAGVNVLLLGPPGVAKSEAVRAVTNAVDYTYFETLLNRYMPPDEILGSLSLSKLKQDRYSRNTSGRLPEAEVAFIDECYKANPGLLNSMLSIVNEHIFHNDGQVMQTPTKWVVFASNETPPKGEADALVDRQIVRSYVGPIRDVANYAKLLRGELTRPSVKIDARHIETLALEAKRVMLSDDFIVSLFEMRNALADKGIYFSDRKAVKATRYLAARCARLGRDTIGGSVVEALEDVLWVEPEQRAIVREIISAHVASWLQDVRETTATIDELEAEMGRAIRTANGIGAKAQAIAKVCAKIDKLREGVLAELKTNKDAASDAARLSQRLDAIDASGGKALVSIGGSRGVQ